MGNLQHLDPDSSLDTVQALVCACLVSVLPRKYARKPLTAATHLFRDLALDSLQILQFISLLEDRCSRQVSERDLKAQPMETIEDVCLFVRRLVTTGVHEMRLTQGE
jgi:acyl carrier protein